MKASALKASDLSAHNREVLRSVKDATRALTPDEAEGLRKLLLLDIHESEPVLIVQLTKLGERVYAETMESGDGPEALKDLLRF